MHRTHSRETGAAQKIVVVVIALLAAAAVLGILTYRLATRDDTDDQKRAADNVQCDYVTDRDLCKFFASWQTTGHYRADATSTNEGRTTQYVLENDEGDDFRLTASGQNDYKIVAIDSTVYIQSNGTWYRQTVEDDIDQYRLDNTFTFPEPASEAEAAAYTAEGTEPCDAGTCFRYRIDSDDGTTHIWFDDELHQLRRVTVAGENDYAYEAKISYDEVSVDAPPASQTTAVAESHVIPPGKTQPTRRTSSDLPATGDQIDPVEYRQWLEQRQRR